MERLTNHQGLLIDCIECGDKYDCYDYSCGKIEEAIETLSRYEVTGLTPQEVQELKERDTAKNVVDYGDDVPECPHCGSHHVYYYEEDMEYNYCPECGQRLKWED